MLSGTVVGRLMLKALAFAEAQRVDVACTKWDEGKEQRCRRRGRGRSLQVCQEEGVWLLRAGEVMGPTKRVPAVTYVLRADGR